MESDDSDDDNMDGKLLRTYYEIISRPKMVSFMYINFLKC